MAQSPETHALLLSGSKYKDPTATEEVGFFEFVREEIGGFFEGARNRKALFLPFALDDHDHYKGLVHPFFYSLDVQLLSAHEFDDPRRAIEEEDFGAIIGGGGNTFRLLHVLQQLNLVSVMKEKIETGESRYLGSSAGTNLANPTIKTTNDMPIVMPRSLRALGLIDFQTNAHYYDGRVAPNHHGETRDERIAEYHEVRGNHYPVVGLPEGTWITVRNGSAVFQGHSAGTLFRRGAESQSIRPGTNANPLLQALVPSDGLHAGYALLTVTEQV